MVRVGHLRRKGFTLIELLIVIGIIAVLAAIIFVAVDPARRFAEARNAQRWSEANAVLNAILKCTVDNNGTLPSAVGSATAGTYYMIGSGTSFAGCTDAHAGAGTTAVMDLGASTCETGTTLAPDYIAQMPVEPGSGTWDQTKTGYYIVKTSSGRITIGACAGERSETIEVTR
ncbi:MAG: prepilin-type N-terminal cleavage/methylation domain-containing protein [Patescibacteria group bacterium]|nr:prepilin-type N-terminal cleavage/methylation domain-containing protein [Patescibacteria group bacterium]